MIILDLFSEVAPQWNRTQSYYGKRWLWCLLHGTQSYILADVDYGGNMGLEGNLPDLTTEPLFALQNTPSMTGIGLTMEGQEGNEVYPLKCLLIRSCTHCYWIRLGRIPLSIHLNMLLIGLNVVTAQPTSHQRFFRHGISSD
jgi:Alpha-N-acetylglucosaminidase (NAGLU) tim-barrel domain